MFPFACVVFKHTQILPLKEACVVSLGIRQLQLVLLKVSLLLGVEVHTGVEFQGLMEPSGENGIHNHRKQQQQPPCLTLLLFMRVVYLCEMSKLDVCPAGWTAKLQPRSHPAAAFQFDVFISAGGGRFVPDGETNIHT